VKQYVLAMNVRKVFAGAGLALSRRSCTGPCAMVFGRWCDLMKALLNLFVEFVANDQAAYSEW